MPIPITKLTPARISRYLRGRWREFVRTTEYDAELHRFITSGPTEQRELRRKLAAAFVDISTKIRCSHAESDILRISDFVLRLPKELPGDIVECGVFKGGASCKLSMVAEATGRRLLLCDSFQGFPEGSGKEDSRIPTPATYQGTLEEVRQNLNLYGNSSSAEFFPGWLQDTLPPMRAASRPLVAVFEDTDLYDAAAVCIQNLYPLLQPGGRIFTHDVIFPAALAAYTDRSVWTSIDEVRPPKLAIVKKAIFRRTGSLAYVQKPKANSL